ncbi:glycosyltransferase family 4 protein [Paraburkholderia sp. Cy-641]|uniref:glycosyltransferase family 4 protein n=1 Tax=Paraburkholderia sp. Cy-641 TaxID=2608337 RepID=UPI00141FDFD5|nr:glycosyltransferase family 1 protein [Paraburkholderia sp. Cy-641]NIF80753.1 glycosyltransferase family 4 protein [Paraburkholderia sp. Cy-641]
MSEKKPVILIEMRPTLDGFAGIPQETRLLFRGLSLVDSIEVEGLLQTSLRPLASGTKPDQQVKDSDDEAERLGLYSNLLISITDKPSKKLASEIARLANKTWSIYMLLFKTLIFRKIRKVKTTLFDPKFFEDFVWQTFFSKTLPSSDYPIVTRKKYRVVKTPWNSFQTVGLSSLKFSAKAAYPFLDTRGAEVFIAQTPYPGRVTKGTSLVVRYHDALPIFMPHLFANKTRHHAGHFHALTSNVKNGAYFACVSESTRQDLLRIAPELKDRAVTIPNMVSHHFFPDESPADRPVKIVRARLNLENAEACPTFSNLSEQREFYEEHLKQTPFKYLLMVSTIEPRKNHTRLISAFEALRAELDPTLKLIVVGSFGWDVDPIVKEMRTWIDQGALFVLHKVPAADLRVLYRHAEATVCPSIAEGFDFSGIESMRSGGIAVASDIPVHREIYDDGSLYFDPYNTESLVDQLKVVMTGNDAGATKQRLRERGQQVSARYLPEAVLPLWRKFLHSVIEAKSSS